MRLREHVKVSGPQVPARQTLGIVGQDDLAGRVSVGGERAQDRTGQRGSAARRSTGRRVVVVERRSGGLSQVEKEAVSVTRSRVEWSLGQVGGCRRGQQERAIGACDRETSKCKQESDEAQHTARRSDKLQGSEVTHRDSLVERRERRRVRHSPACQIRRWE